MRSPMPTLLVAWGGSDIWGLLVQRYGIYTLLGIRLRQGVESRMNLLGAKMSF